MNSTHCRCVIISLVPLVPHIQRRAAECIQLTPLLLPLLLHFFTYTPMCVPPTTYLSLIVREYACSFKFMPQESRQSVIERAPFKAKPMGLGAEPGSAVSGGVAWENYGLGAFLMQMHEFCGLVLLLQLVCCRFRSSHLGELAVGVGVAVTDGVGAVGDLKP